MRDRNRAIHPAARSCAAVVVAVAMGLLGWGKAVAAPSPSVQEARRQVTALREQAEAATERYNAIKEELSSLDVRLAAAGARLEEQEAALIRARQRLGQIAADTYKAGDLAALALFLSPDPDEYVHADGLLVSLGDRRAQAVADLQRQRQLLVAAMTDVEEQEERLERTQRELRQAKQEIERKLGEADRVLSRLTGDQRDELAAEDEADYRNGLAGQGFPVPRSGRLTCNDVPMVPLDARAAKVIAYACAQIGDPYRWGASGPDQFDCSGLTMLAWKQSGVSLPHNAAMQATYGTTIGRDDLRPGDLVFFFNPIGHNGIYIGNGLMIHAPRSGDRVKIAPIRDIGAFATAVRL